ncbi:hypothetical protein Hden_0382 [Hyphomicrobium denitrificans ATCC 51888]|jgi:hypothetical protein|uniref:Uncharacterized protein n=1 Tax=Hyphomicrobium denitrificans (strain ATCC 51888 / DSM 1869 / NCIMB 11706 / TK 0415) TaxID=582899 RepID=D8JRH5_HYPDA|nr:hypothetical protein [Hyphomicrobium denitrificans]ADJ22204.1 hypothetical protein Hden_0382 [Hyphomicrobium denitrificans ATCC 51888]
MKLDPFVATILSLAAFPTFLISVRSASGWRAGVVFAAFYPALVLIVGAFMIATFITLASLGIIDLD